MANQKEIEAMYDWVDYFHTLRLGDYADFTGALFDGDFSKTLDQAQEDKHDWIFRGTNVRFPGARVLDVGCGWGPILNEVRTRGGSGLGLTLSSAQRNYGKRNGLDVRLQDWKTANGDLGVFDAVISVGAFEHFCSVDEFKAGRQKDIYRAFFKFCSDHLPQGGRLYLQTMTWGKKIPNPDDFSLDAPEGSDELVLARATRFYPGSWLPAGLNQMKEAASPYFDFISTKNGRLDYIETLSRWGDFSTVWQSTEKTYKAVKAGVKLLPRLLDPNFRTQLAFLYHEDQTTCFKREIMSHERMFFQKK